MAPARSGELELKLDPTVKVKVKVAGALTSGVKICSVRQSSSPSIASWGGRRSWMHIGVLSLVAGRVLLGSG